MTKKIIDKVLEKKAALTDSTVAADNKKKAIAAVTGGFKSPAWRIYMEQFVDRDEHEQLNTQQLMRLLATDNTDTVDALIVCRAYMVGNGVCGEGTKDHFDELVRSIDADLGSNCDPS